MDIAELRSKAEAGSVVAQTVLGICYLDGIDVEVDYTQAFQFLSIAAKRGASRARANLARMYAQGLGIPRDVPKAIPLYEAAARSGEFFAQVALGRLYSRGEGVPANPDAALSWYSAALAQQDRVAYCKELEEAKDYVATNFNSGDQKGIT